MLRDRERFDLVAHFPTAEAAQSAEGTIGGHLEQKTSVTFGLGSWLGLGLGLAFGAGVGLFLSHTFLPAGFSPAILSQRGILVTILWAAILGATGWMLGSAIHLFSTVAEPDRFELHITVQADRLAQTKDLLVARGAVAISIREHNVTDSAVQLSGHGQGRTPVHEPGN